MALHPEWRIPVTRLLQAHSGIARSAQSLCVAALVLLISAPTWGADRIELLSGAKLEGEIVSRDEKSITINIVLGGRPFTRTYPVNRIHAVVSGDRREVLNEPDAAASESPAASPRTGSAGRAKRTKAAVDAMIDAQGRAKPDWWDSTPLVYPSTLDLDYPERPSGPWNREKNIGQYMWDVINPNPGKWREGVRFMHHVLSVNQDKPIVRRRVMNDLGRMYCVLLQDYARAAYWWRKAGVDQDDRFWNRIHLAECYWKLGNAEMALDLLRRTEPQFGTVKLLADMGRTAEALKLAQSWMGQDWDDVVCIYAGDACRVAGDQRKAMQFYQKVLDLKAEGKAKRRIERNQRRARANLDGLKLFDLLDLAKVPDGTYRAASLGYEADVEVEVKIQAGRIEDVRVVQHREKQFYSSISETCQKIIARQAVTGIDATSGATITSEAIVNATAKALAPAMKP